MLRQAQFVHCSDMSVDNAENNFNPEPLPDHADAVTSVLVRISKVGIAARMEFLLVDFGHESLCQRYRLFCGQWWSVQPHWLQRSMHPPDRWRGDAQMNVRSVRLLADLEVVIHVRQWMRFNGDLRSDTCCDHGRALGR